MVNLTNLVNFGGGGGLAVGDWTYSAYPLSAPAFLPLNSDTASYLTSSYPALGAIYAAKTVAYSAVAITMPAPSSYLAYGNNTFLAISGGSVATSFDGSVWSVSGSTVAPTGKVGYGNGKFAVITGAPGTYSIAVSNDGGASFNYSSGYKQTAPYSGGGNANIVWTDIVHTGNLFVTMGNYVRYYYADVYDTYYISFVSGVSSDGLNYTYTISTGLTMYSYNGAGFSPASAYGGGNLVYSLCGAYNEQVGVSTSYMIYSPNLGVSWAAATTPPPSASAKIVDIAYGAGLFVALNGSTGGATANATNVYYTSPTGQVWTARTMPASLFWNSITYANGNFVAVGSTASATTTIYTSSDGISWTARTVPSATGITGRGWVIGGGGKYVFTDNNVGATRLGSGVLINLSTASASFSLPIIRSLSGTQTYVKAT